MPAFALTVFMQNLSVSVALCTYNGARYIDEQLASINAQTIRPDELIVVDDRSTDSTVQQVQEFAENVTFPVRIIVNETNLGSTRNFEKALNHCTGDIILFCDQDDSWYPNRVSRTITFFKDNPEYDALFSDAQLIDGRSELQNRRIWEEIDFNEKEKAEWRAGRGYTLLFNKFVVTGATLAIRRSALSAVLPFPTHIHLIIHDAWVALILAFQNKIMFVEDCLIMYRQHDLQQVGFKAIQKKVTLGDRFVRNRSEKLKQIEKEALRNRQLYELLSSRTDIDKRKLEQLRIKKDYLQKRASLPANRLLRIVPVFQELISGNYRRFSGHYWKTVLGDLLE